MRRPVGLEEGIGLYGDQCISEIPRRGEGGGGGGVIWLLPPYRNTYKEDPNVLRVTHLIIGLYIVKWYISILPEVSLVSSSAE